MNTEFNIELTSEEEERICFLAKNGITPKPIFLFESTKEHSILRDKLLARGFTQRVNVDSAIVAKELQELLAKYKLYISDTIYINTSKDGVLTIMSDIIGMNYSK
jgi:hypothetical protein